MFADTHTATLKAHTRLAAVRTLIALTLTLPTGATLEAGLQAAAKAVDLEAIREEVLLAAGAPDGLLLIAVVRHCLLISVYQGFPFI